jgi:hypothetical protein
VLWSIRNQLRLDWIEDLIVCLYRELGVMAEYRELHSIPVFYGPPHLLETVFELAGLYHEFGHSVSAKHKDINTELAILIGRYFKEVKTRPGPLTPDQKETRDKTINQYAEAWTEAARTEILCDIFGAYTCGTALLRIDG